MQVIAAIFIIYLIGLFIVKIVWPFLVEVVFPIAGTIAIIFLLFALAYTLFVVVADLYRSFRMVRENRQRAAPLYLEGEARIAYLFSPVKEDLKLFFQDNFRRARAHVRSAASRIAVAHFWPRRQFFRANWLFAVTFGLATSLLVAAVLAVACLVAAAVLAAVFLLLYVIDITYMALRGVFAYCPECHHNSFHMHYDCPRCPGRRQRHRHLRVNRAGALYHICTCGNRVPSHILTGRGRGMNAYCALHEHAINAELIGAKVTHAALVGGPDSGKTTVLIGILQTLLGDPKYRAMGFRLEDPIQRRLIEGWIEDLSAGVNPPKTAKRRHRATTVLYDSGGGNRRSLYLFDPSGEMFADAKLMASHGYFDSSDLILFALDPLSMQGFRDLATTRLGKAMVAEATPSEMRPILVASSLVAMMDANGARRRRGRFVVPIYVVVTKSDVLAIAHAFSGGPAIRQWISRNGGDDVLRLLEANFNDIRMTYVSLHEVRSKGRVQSAGLAALATSIVEQAQDSSAGRSRVRHR